MFRKRPLRADRMKPSAFYDRIVDVMEELVEFALLVFGTLQTA